MAPKRTSKTYWEVRRLTLYLTNDRDVRSARRTIGVAEQREHKSFVHLEWEESGYSLSAVCYSFDSRRPLLEEMHRSGLAFVLHDTFAYYEVFPTFSSKGTATRVTDEGVQRFKFDLNEKS